MKTLYFDCFCGASGDMIVGALIDAGADFEMLRSALATLDVTGYELAAEKITKHGIGATQFNVKLDPDQKQPHRHLKHVLEIIDSGDLPDAVKAASAETFRRIAECEAEVHGTTVEKVHFHEVGAVDSIVDIVGAHLALNSLGIERVFASPLHVGSGTVKCAHGIMPVPAPATAALLKGIPNYGGEVDGELVTPTGAALVGQLAESFGPAPQMRAESIGYGSGTKDIPDRANVLRVTIGELAAEQHVTETIEVIEANIDDMIPEMYPPLIEELLKADARDAFVTPIVAKKGRPGHLVTVLCDAERVQEIVAVIFANTTTLGIRMRTERRICLERDWETVQTQWGDVRIKIGRLDGRVSTAAPEFEDCRKVAEEAGVPVLNVYNEALAIAKGKN